MTKVDFYVSKEATFKFALRTACRIAEKAFQAGLQVHIQTNDPRESQELDILLWTFRDRSFIPHEISTADKASCPVTISNEQTPENTHVLINISKQLPENTANFQRIAEVIDNQPDSVVAGRERYRFYREQGLEPSHHEVV